MNDNATRVLNAAVAGQEVMDDPMNVGVWSGKPAVVTKKTALDNKITEIEQLDDSETDGSGESAGKRAARLAAANTAWKITKPLAIFAKDTGNTTLEGEIDFEWSDVRYGKDQDVINNWQLIHDKANANSALLDSGGYVDIALIPLLLTQINAFKDKRGKPKAKRSDNKGINEAIEARIKELKTIKTDLLDLLVQFADSNTEFFNAVKAAFELDMTGVRHLALRLRFEDEATEIRLPGVEAEIKELGLKKISSANGVIEFSQQELAQGNYTLLVKAATYKDQELKNTGIQSGKLKTIEVVMQKGENSGGGKGSISGTVTYMGNPMAGAKVTLSPGGNETNSNATGNYSFADVGAATYSVTAELPPSPANPSGLSQTKPAVVSAGVTVTVNFSF
ncbi:MAG: carboxypeptidase-like regulatory domain-containing protein [Bacteroidia bacterium]